jgi:alcohol dehydrogenase
VQVGLMAGDDYHPAIPMELVIANELEIVGSHGMQAYEYDRMLQMITDDKLCPQKLVCQTIDLQRAASALGNPAELQVAGITVIDRFSVTNKTP